MTQATTVPNTGKAATAWHAWGEGDIDDATALRGILPALDALERQIASLEAQRQLWRSRLSAIVSHVGGRTRLVRYGELLLTAPSQTVTYDRKALDDLTRDLLAEGDAHTAQRLAAARKVTERAGGTLMIRRDREKETTHQP